MEMEAGAKNFQFMQAESEIKIPFYQRAYVWGEEQWKQLFEDLKESYKQKKEHFLGSIILKQLRTGTGEGSERSLIDGQQRLTTFSILLKVLYDELDEDDKQDNAQFLFKRPTKEKKPKIQHSKFDRESFNKIMQAQNFDALKESERYTKGKLKGKIKDRLIACYEYFTTAIKEIKDDEKGYEPFLNHIINCKLWVSIDLDSNEDEQKIFDSINTSGVKLTATDIIKNAIFDKAMELKLDYEMLYHKCWECVFELEKREFWQEEVATGRIKRVQSEIFLHAFAIIYDFFDSDKDTLEQLSYLYKKQIEQYNENNKEELESLLSKIKETAEIYQSFPHFYDKDTSLCFANNEQRLFHILHITDTSTIMPLILALKLKIKDEVMLKSCLKLLEIFILTAWLCDKNAKSYNKLFAHITQNFDKAQPLQSLRDELKNHFPTKDDIQKHLRSQDTQLSNKKAGLILFWIELYRRDNNKQDSKDLAYKWTLEHLMPQSYKQHWGEIAKDEEHAESLIYQIGNMTLLNGSLNKAIKNAAWEIKLKGDDTRTHCIKKCGDLLITKELFDEEIWNEDSIKKRTQKLTEEFFNIWDIESFANRA